MSLWSWFRRRNPKPWQRSAEEYELETDYGKFWRIENVEVKKDAANEHYREYSVACMTCGRSQQHEYYSRTFHTATLTPHKVVCLKCGSKTTLEDIQHHMRANNLYGGGNTTLAD